MKYVSICFLAVLSLACAYPNKFGISREDPPAASPCPAKCPWFGVYDLPHFANCNRYYRCVHGFFFDLECEVGKLFDHVSLSCVEEGSRCVFEGPVTEAPPTIGPPITFSSNE